MEIVPLKTTVNASVIDKLEYWLKEAKKGEVVGLTMVVETKDGGVVTVESDTMSRLQTIGALMEMVVARVDPGKLMYPDEDQS